MSKDKYPEGWDEDRVRAVLDHYEAQTDEESVAEDEDRMDSSKHTVMEVPSELVPTVRSLIAKQQGA